MRQYLPAWVSCVDDCRINTPLKWGSFINCKQYSSAKWDFPEPAELLCDARNHSCITASVGLYLVGFPTSSFQHRLMLTLLPSTYQAWFR